MKPGDLVRVVALSPAIPDNPESKLVFERSVGHTFPIVDITADGLVELDVGDILGESTDPELVASHTIWIEPECLELVQARSAP
ncbi:MAG TPA: hypothetical protein VJ790_12620 [Dongiaceae bacterium]|nr:hypothetical protein [Dongiaceae bacterium]